MYYKEYFSKLIMEEEVMKGTICIDGVVGVGKSTLGKILADELGIHFFPRTCIKQPSFR